MGLGISGIMMAKDKINDDIDSLIGRLEVISEKREEIEDGKRIRRNRAKLAGIGLLSAALLSFAGYLSNLGYSSAERRANLEYRQKSHEISLLISRRQYGTALDRTGSLIRRLDGNWLFPNSAVLRKAREQKKIAEQKISEDEKRKVQELRGYLNGAKDSFQREDYDRARSTLESLIRKVTGGITPEFKAIRSQSAAYLKDVIMPRISAMRSLESSARAEISQYSAAVRSDDPYVMIGAHARSGSLIAKLSGIRYDRIVRVRNDAGSARDRLASRISAIARARLAGYESVISGVRRMIRHQQYERAIGAAREAIPKVREDIRRRLFSTEFVSTDDNASARSLEHLMDLEIRKAKAGIVKREKQMFSYLDGSFRGARRAYQNEDYDSSRVAVDNILRLLEGRKGKGFDRLRKDVLRFRDDKVGPALSRMNSLISYAKSEIRQYDSAYRSGDIISVINAGKMAVSLVSRLSGTSYRKIVQIRETAAQYASAMKDKVSGIAREKVDSYYSRLNDIDSMIQRGSYKNAIVSAQEAEKNLKKDMGLGIFSGEYLDSGYVRRAALLFDLFRSRQDSARGGIDKVKRTIDSVRQEMGSYDSVIGSDDPCRIVEAHKRCLDLISRMQNWDFEGADNLKSSARSYDQKFNERLKSLAHSRFAQYKQTELQIRQSIRARRFRQAEELTSSLQNQMDNDKRCGLFRYGGWQTR